jgi:Asp-tRNA(Asn)/Glu-tRNA(Gln) amidotransferase C subunit
VKTEFKKSVARDLKKRSQEKKLLTQVQEIIEAVEQVERLEELNVVCPMDSNGVRFFV